MRNLLVTFIAAVVLVPVMAFGQGYDLDNDRPRRRRSSGGGSSWISAGFASDDHLLNTLDTGLTAMFDISRKSAIQAYLVIPQSDPSLYSIAGAFKYTISGSKKLGFHVGGGLGIGSHAEDQSFMRISGIMGFHFRVAKRVLVHLDGGLTLTNDDTGNPNDDKDSQTIISGHSQLFGLSLMYML